MSILAALLALLALVVPADATQPAVRLDPPDPPPTIEATVNALPYSADAAAPAMLAFALVAHGQGMTLAWIDSWQVAVDDIMRYESQFCWNVRGGARFAGNGAGCAIARQGTGSDAGFGQVTSVLRGDTCEMVNVCSTAETVATPFASMSALVAVLRRYSVAPWCYSAWARSYHRVACTNPGLAA